MYKEIINRLKDKGNVVYNAYNYSMTLPRYIVPLPLEFSEPIGEIDVDTFVESMDEERSEVWEFITDNSNRVFQENIFFEIDAQDSFFCWTADLYFDDLDEAIKQAWLFDVDEIYDRQDDEILYISEEDDN